MEDDIPFLPNTKIEIVKNNELKYKAEIVEKKKRCLTFSMGEVYRDLEIKSGNTLQYFCGRNESISRIFYNCYSKVINLEHNDNKIFIDVSYPPKIDLLGVRSFFRLPIEMEVYYRLINYFDHYSSVDEVPTYYYRNMISATSIDISGSGIKIEAEKFCRKGQEIVIMLPNLNDMKLLGTIQWLEPDKFNQNKLA